VVASDVDPTLPFTMGKDVAYPAACRAGTDCNRVLMFSATVTNWTGEYRLWGSTTWKVTTSLRSYPGSGRGRFLATTAGRGSGPGISYAPHSLATDANGNVYVADGGNARIQVFNNNLNLLATYYGMGAPWAICITRGRHQYLYSASNPDKTDNRRHEYSVGEVYKLELDGTILGKVVGDDASRGSFQILHHIECRRANEIIGVDIADSLPQLITLSAK
jgi:hypothetical protein